MKVSYRMTFLTVYKINKFAIACVHTHISTTYLKRFSVFCLYIFSTIDLKRFPVFHVIQKYLGFFSGHF